MYDLYELAVYSQCNCLTHTSLTTIPYCCDTAGDVSLTAPTEAIPLIAIRVISQSGHEVVVSVIPTKAGNVSSK